MEQQATPAPHTPHFINSPLGIAALMLVSSIGGGWVRDRLSTETRDTGSVVRIEAIDRRVTEFIASAVSRGQFEASQGATEKRLDEIRQDVRDIKRSLDARPERGARR
jgi:hypothetical protein